MSDPADTTAEAGAEGNGGRTRDVTGAVGEGGGLGWARSATNAVGRGLADRIVLAGTLLIVASLVLRGYVLGEAYFIEDDFLFVGEAATASLTWDYLVDLHKGHLMPGALLLVYVQTAIAPYDWTLTAGVMLTVQAGAFAGAFRLFWVVFGRRWSILAPLAVYVFAPLTLPVLAWWSAALNAVPFQLAIVLALLWTVRHLRTGDPRYGWLAAGAVAFGMAFTVKAMLLPPVLFVVAAAFLVPGRFPNVVRTTFVRDAPYWVSMAALTIGYGLFYLTRDDSGGEGAAAPETDPAIEASRALLGETFPAGALGGPIDWHPVTPAGGLIDPRMAVLVGAWAALVLVVLVSLLVRRRAWRAWAILAGYLVVVDVIPTLLARGRYDGTVGHDPRYVADGALLFAICLAFAFLAAREETETGNGGVYRARWSGYAARVMRPVAVVATLAFLATASYSTYTFADTLSGDRVRWYLDTVRASMEEVPEEAGIYPRPVPEDVVLPWNGERRLSHTVLGPLAPDEVGDRVSVPGQASRAMVFNDGGHLVDAEPAAESAFYGPPEGEECVTTADGDVIWEVPPAGGDTYVLGMGYEAEEPTVVNAAVGDTWVEATLPAAPNGGNWYVPMPGEGEELLLSTDPGTLCLWWVSHGELDPVTQGDPMQELAEEDEEGAGSDGEESGDDGE